jgi:hypothetical protein
MAACSESALSEMLAVFDISLSTLLIQDFEQLAILCLAWNDYHILEVFRSGADE